MHKIKGLNASTDNFRNSQTGTWAQMRKNITETMKIRGLVEEGLMNKLGNGATISVGRWELEINFPYTIHNFTTKGV